MTRSSPLLRQLSLQGSRVLSTLQGRYRMRGEVYGYQTTQPAILTFNVGDYGKGSTRILRAFDIPPNTPTQVEVEMFLELANISFPM